MPNSRSFRTEVSIMGIPFINTKRKDLLEKHLIPRLKDQKKSFVVTANPEIVMRTKENKAFKKVVLRADYIVPDGAGIIIASKMMKEPIMERIPGFELMLDLLDYADSHRLSCYFLGAKDHVNEKAVLRAKRDYPNLKVAGHHHGFFSISDVSIAEQVKTTNPDLVFVALGSPKQEKWINTYYDQFSKGLFMGVGGSFDVLSGEVKRAPEKWINMNLEWLYRLLKQPFRLKRILKSMKFMIRMIVMRK